ncbi:DUF1772 domain-containing protein [Mycobacterium sp. PS03-16]|uniref:anthrone oxygenase family protein n=1 Tax=Mycobacterium sp. PS03-16 TaxID=2559611 RepID=UPI0010748568|nr:anthrone oxygenase family protein [Mycobacterium sp. PS03-16]TFV55333.1 DUF1772 domain-containing protein [Mycobacterium sp. PS03-16]
MNSGPVLVLTAVTAVACTAVGGIFFAFSTFVMRGLDRTDPAEAITAMRGINAEAQANAAFLILFLGSALLAVAVGALGVLRWGAPGGWLLVAGGVCGVTGFVVTVAFNIPLNNHLDGLTPDTLSAVDAAREWAHHLRVWTLWNHVRTATGLAAGALLIAALVAR